MVYNPSEPRDPLGKWMKAHGGNPKASLADNVKISTMRKSMGRLSIPKTRRQR